MIECCGECEYSRYDGVDYYCCNEDSDNYGCGTMYDEKCPEFEEKI